jgi:hypothetical protein
MRTWRRRKETLGLLGEYAKRHKSVYISVNNITNFILLKILFTYTIWNGLSQKTISPYGPLKVHVSKAHAFNQNKTMGDILVSLKEDRLVHMRESN